jgi:osmotically inducible protein OsmC
MIHYPQHYHVRSSSPAGIQTTWNTRTEGGGHQGELICAIPPEFQGPGGGASPEDLYAMALANCFVATFKVFAEKSSVTFDGIGVEGELTVDRDEKGVPWMAKFHLFAKVSGASDAARVKTLLEKTSRSCLILNSVKTEKTFDFQVA